MNTQLTVTEVTRAAALTLLNQATRNPAVEVTARADLLIGASGIASIRYICRQHDQPAIGDLVDVELEDGDHAGTDRAELQARIHRVTAMCASADETGERLDPSWIRDILAGDEEATAEIEVAWPGDPEDGLP